MPNVYGFCDNNCRWPVYTQEQILSILQQAIEAGSLQGINPEDSPVVALIREGRANKEISLWVGTEAEYNALTPTPDISLVMGRIGADGKIYFCTDDSTLQDWHDKTVRDAEAAVERAVGQKLAFSIGDTEPLAGPMLWFNTAVNNSGVESVLLSLDDTIDEGDVVANINGTDSGVQNASVNSDPTEQGQYNFDITQ